MIRQLSDEVQSHLRSGVAITSLTQCVEELIMNALDAGASCIAVRVDLPCFKVQAVDNGQGIGRDQLEKVGERYSTSKCHELEDLNNLQYFGYRGEAIASMRDTAAVLEINSRTSRSHQTYCKMFQKGVAQAVSESVIHRPSIGTTVTAHDLFYSLPVRKKNMNEALELERIRYRVEGIALIHPSVSFSLRNDINGNILLQTQKSSSVLTAFMHLFGTGKSKCLREVSLQEGCFQVEGFIGKEGHCSKSLQFVYVNGRLVLKTKVHKILNHTLGRSLVLKRKGSNFEGSMGGSQLAGAPSSSPPKQGDKYAMFVINVKCPLDAYDITFDPAKTLVEFKDWTALTDGIDEMIMEFLKKENLVSVSDLSVVSPVTVPGESSQSDALKIPDSGDGAPQGGEDAEGSKSGINQATDSSDPEAKVKDYTENISTLNASNCLFSKRVRRPRDVMAIRRNQLIQDESLINQKDEDSVNSENISKSSTEVNVINETPVLHAQNSSDGDMSDKNGICTAKSSQTPAQTPIAGKYQKPPEMNNSTLYSSESLHEAISINLLTSTVTDHQSGDGKEVADDNISEEPMQLPESIAVDITASNPSDDSEDPLPSTLRASLTKMKSDTLYNVETETKAFICLPDSPPSASTSGRQKLQNLHLISQKSKSSAVEMCKRLGLAALRSLSETRADEEHAEKSAAKKINERLVLNARSAAGKRIISAKLQKFKNTNLETRQCSNNPGTSGNQTTGLSEPLAREASSEQIRGSETSIVYGESAKKEACHDYVHSSFTQLRDSCRTSSLPSQDDFSTIHYGEQIAHQQTFVTNVPSSSTVQDIAVVSTSAIQIQQQPSLSRAAAEQYVSERSPVVPTLDDIEHLTSTSEHSDRKRFNPFALSTAAKLSKLAKRSCVDDSCVKTCSREFLSSSSFVETPASVFKDVENVISDKNENKVETLVDTAVPDPLELPTAPTDFEADGNNPVTSSSEKSLQGSDLNQNVTCERGRTGRTLLPFTSYSDRVCDRVDDSTMPDYLDLSETESVDSVILPHVDICSPEVSDQEGGSPPAYCTQSFQPTGLSSQGFTMDVKAYDEDCQSGGFSPNVDRVTPMTGSPSSPAGKVDYVYETLPGLTGDGSVIGEEEEDVADPDLPDSSFSVLLPSGTSCWNKEEKSGDSESEMTLADSCSITTSKPSYISMKKEDDFASDSPLISLPHSTFEDCPDFNSLTCGQRSPQQADSTKLTSTDDSFPLRKLLPGDSQDNEIQVYGRGYSDDVSETMPDRAQSTHQQTKSSADNSCIGVPMEVTPTEAVLENLNEIDENLAKEFDNEMTENFVDSREITLDDIHTKSCSSNHGSSQCDGEQACDSSCGPVSDVNIGNRDLGSSCFITGDTDDQPSCSSTGTHIQTVTKPTWSDVEDPKTGKKIYVNSLTGNTMFEDQWKQCGYENDGDTDEGSGTLIVKDDPVPLSPSGRQKLQNLLECHLVAESSDDQIKWRQPPSAGKDQVEEDEAHSLEDLFSSWNNPVLEIPLKSCVSAEVSHTSKAATRSFKSLYPTKFTKAMLKSFQVLGQVDNKFIACVLQTEELNSSKAPDLIVLFDQHAAHERVRLEQLTEDIYVNSDDVTDCSIKSSQVSPPRTLTFTEENVRLIKSFRDEFKRIGVTFTINGSSRDSLNIHSIPACLVEREANEVRRGRESVVMDIVEILIKDHLEVLKMMRGARSRLPQTIHKVLCSQACHGAIKFGDSLTLSQCRELLESLAECNLPFQCAHGRPSVMPLLSLQQLHAKVPPEKTKRPSLWKISRHLSIHQ